jgi:hypothetical protein
MTGCETLIGAGDCVRPYITDNYPDLPTLIAAVLTLTVMVWAVSKIGKLLKWVLFG